MNRSESSLTLNIDQSESNFDNESAVTPTKNMKLSFLKDNSTKLKNNKDDYYLGEEDFDLKRKRSKSFSELLLPNFKEIVPITVRFTSHYYVSTKSNRLFIPLFIIILLIDL